jgi:hypothetical protein
MPKNNMPRKPTDKELRELAVNYIERYSDFYSLDDIDDVLVELAKAYIAVFDDYQPDIPDYAGKLMMVVWVGGPAFSETYIWKDVLNVDTKKLVKVKCEMLD